MGKEEQRQWERKWAPFAAVAAFAATVFSLGAFIYQRSISPAPKNTAQYFVSLDNQSGKYLLATILSGIGACLLAPVLYYLYRAIKVRRPAVPKVALVLAIIAPIAYGGLVVATSVHQTSVAHEFVKDEPGAREVVVGEKIDKKEDDRKGSINDRAKDKISAGGALAGVSIAATLSVAIAFVLICLNAMRTGLLSRFLGSLGMVIGALYIFQVLLPPALVQLFWLPAVGLVFLDRWPQGRGPAWDAVEEIPWPTAQDRRNALADSDEPVRGGGQRAQEPDDEQLDEHEEPVTQHTREAARPRASASHPRSKKRKRKRRG